MSLRSKPILPALLLFASTALWAGDFNVPSTVTAGENTAVTTSGSGKGTFYLSGPGTAIKRSVKLGEEIALAGDDLRRAGRYTAVLETGGSPTTKAFYVVPGKPEKINLIARRSRRP